MNGSSQLQFWKGLFIVVFLIFWCMCIALERPLYKKLGAFDILPGRMCESEPLRIGLSLLWDSHSDLGRSQGSVNNDPARLHHLWFLNAFWLKNEKSSFIDGWRFWSLWLFRNLYIDCDPHCIKRVWSSWRFALPPNHVLWPRTNCSQCCSMDLGRRKHTTNLGTLITKGVSLCVHFDTQNVSK